MMNYFKKPLFTLLTIGVLATACEGTADKAPQTVAAITPTPIADPGTVATDPTVAAPVGETPAPAVETTVIADVDADGFGEDADCDDNNASVNPGVVESPFAGNSGRNANGIDDNCDNEVDEADCDCDDFKGFRLPGSDMQADAASEPDAVADPEATDSEVSAVEKAGGHKRKQAINKMCMNGLEKFKALPNWDCVEAPEGKGQRNGHGQRDGQGRGQGKGDKPGRGGNRPGHHGDGGETGGGDSTDADTSEVTTGTGSMGGEAAETGSSIPADGSYIRSLKFTVHTLDKASSSLNENNWNQMKIIVNLTGKRTVSCDFAANSASIHYPNDNTGTGWITKQDTDFSFTFEILDKLSSCGGLDPDKYKAAAKVSDILDIRLQGNGGGIDLGVKSVKIEATLTNDVEDTGDTRVMFYNNQNVYAYVLGGHNDTAIYPLPGQDCAGKAVYGGYVGFPGSERNGSDAYGINGNYTPELAAADTLVFAPGDKEVHIKARSKDEFVAGSMSQIRWTFEGKAADFNSNNTACDIKLFTGLHRDETLHAYFYVSNALTDAEVADGGIFSKRGTEKDLTNNELNMDYVIATVKDCWSNDGSSRKEWGGKAENFKLNPDTDNQKKVDLNEKISTSDSTGGGSMGGSK